MQNIEPNLGRVVYSHNFYFMFELLVPATHAQMDVVEGDQHLYDRDLRPSLMVAALDQPGSQPLACAAADGNVVLQLRTSLRANRTRSRPRGSRSAQRFQNAPQRLHPRNRAKKSPQGELGAEERPDAFA